MNCDNAREFFDLLIDNQSAVEHSVILHMENCSACRAELDKWRKIHAIFKNTPTPSPPKGLAEEILARIPPGTAESSPHPTSTLVKGPWMWPALAMAAMLVLGVGIWFLYQGPSKDPGTRKSLALVSEQDKVQESVPEQSLNVDLHLPAAESVALVGDFNDWNKDSHPLKRDKQGSWRITLALRSGYFQYQLLVDGKKWILDPGNPVVIPDGFGSRNSGVFL